MKTLAEIEKKIDENMEAIRKVGKIIGYSSFSEKGNDKIAAIECAWKCTEFAETVEDFIQNVEEADVEEKIKKLVKQFLRHGLGLED